LRTAQLALIRELRSGRVTVATPAGSLAIPEDPAFWAGFVLLGEPVAFGVGPIAYGRGPTTETL
jgi:CHAT domain-containing protein